MEEVLSEAPKKRNTKQIIANILAWTLVCIFFLVILSLLLIQTSPVQNFARQKIQNYLQNKLKTKVNIGKINISFPSSILLQNFLIEDQTKDTLVAGKELKVNLDMFKLLKSELIIREIDLTNITTKIKRVGTDTVFNFQFIANAFASGSKPNAAKDTSSMKLKVDNIVLNNTRIIYQDVITGNDLNLFLSHLDMPIKTFDPDHLYFDIPKFKLTGLKGYFYQNIPLKPKIDSAVAQAVLAPGKYLQLHNAEISFNDIDVDYKSAPNNISTSFRINSFTAHPTVLDVRAGKFDLKDVSLDNSSIGVVMSDAKAPAITVKQQQAKDVIPFFTITSNALDISGSNLTVDNTSMPVLKNGMDYGHLSIRKIELHGRNFLYNADTTIIKIDKASMNEKSGFVLNELNTDFLFTDKIISAKNLYLKTPGTVLRKDIIINYPSLNQLIKDPFILSLDLNIQSSKLLVKDIVTLAPMLKSYPAFANTWQTWMINGKVKGKINDLNFQDLRFNGLNNTTFFVSGNIRGLPDVKKFQADLNLPYFNTTKKDILAFMPKGAIPSTITLPDVINAKGKIKGSTNNLYTDLNISSSLGSATLKGTINGFSIPSSMKYNMAVTTHNLNLGVIMQDTKTYGLLNSNFSIQGTGTDPMRSNITLNSVTTSFTYNGYTYNNIQLNGSIKNKVYHILAIIKDPNARLTAQVNGVYNGANSSLHIIADVDSIKLMPLHFSTQQLVYAGKIDADLTNTNPDQLTGNIFMAKSTIISSGMRFQLDSVKLLADNSNGMETLHLQAQFMDAIMKGHYKLSQLADIFQQAIDPYFNMAVKKNTAKTETHDIIITARVFDHPALRAFIPALTRFDSISINASLSSTTGLNAKIDAPMFIYGTYEIAGLKFSGETKNNQVVFTSSIDHFISRKNIAVYATSLSGTIANNIIDFVINTKDAKGKDKYALSALLSQPSPDNYIFQLKPVGLLLNYEKWAVNSNNSIQFMKGDLEANNFVLNKANEQLIINSVGQGTNRPVSIDFKTFELSTLTAFVQSDSTLLNGQLNGNILVKNYMVQPTFTADLNVNNFSVNKDTLGNIAAKINNIDANKFNTDITLTGHDNDVSIKGDYFVKQYNNSDFDFIIAIKQLQLKSLEGPSMNSFRYSTGSINGNISLKGTLDKPVVNGKLNFDKAGFNITQLNNYFRVDNQSIAINNDGASFNNFTIRDSANNDLVINGKIVAESATFYTFDLHVTADNFQVINTTKRDNKLFYGKMYFATDLSITGNMYNPVVDGSITINDKTKFSIVLPQNEPAIQERKGIVQFVNMAATKADSLFRLPYDTLNTSKLKGFNVTTNIQVNKNAEFNLIIDEGNGDFINLKGEALLNGGIDPSGKITLVGSYEISQGSYALSFNFIKRKFDIQKGSKIVWTGEPTKADINVSGVYIANASPLDLVQNQLSEATNLLKNTYRQKLPFEVWLTLSGELMQPAITFDIRLPEDKSYNVSRDIISTVEYKLAELEGEPSELNKQVFALILLNRFVNQDPFSNSNGALDPANFVLTSVSKILSDQLNKLASGLISGVDINFDLVNTDDYTTGEKRTRTDFNIGLSKQLLNDRLVVTVGSNFELQGPTQTNQASNNVAGNIAIDYKLSRDGRYLLRAYRKNDFQGVIEGYVIETGLGFIINVDYNDFKDIFKRAKPKAAKKNTSTLADDKQKVSSLKPSNQ